VYDRSTRIASPAKSTSRHLSATSSPRRIPVNAAVRKITPSCDARAEHTTGAARLQNRLQKRQAVAVSANKKAQKSAWLLGLLSGAYRDRTGDLRLAKLSSALPAVPG
jgi:hypothetical protein